jgi:hypothetical protein
VPYSEGMARRADELPNDPVLVLIDDDEPTMTFDDWLTSLALATGAILLPRSKSHSTGCSAPRSAECPGGLSSGKPGCSATT